MSYIAATVPLRTAGNIGNLLKAYLRDAKAVLLGNRIILSEIGSMPVEEISTYHLGNSTIHLRILHGSYTRLYPSKQIRVDRDTFVSAAVFGRDHRSARNKTIEILKKLDFENIRVQKRRYRSKF